MYKRGQIAIFLVIGIVVLGLFAGIFFLVKNTREGEIRDSSFDNDATLDVAPGLTMVVENCMRKTLEKALVIAGKNAGRVFFTSSDTFVTEREVLAYGYNGRINNGRINLNATITSEQLAFYVDLYLPNCTGTFSSFINQGFTVETESISRPVPQFANEIDLPAFTTSSEILLKRNAMILRTQYPLTLERGNERVEFASFEIRYDSPLGGALEDGVALVNHYQLQHLLDMEYISSFEPYITLFPYDPSTFVVSMDYGQDATPRTFFFVVEDGVLPS